MRIGESIPDALDAGVEVTVAVILLLCAISTTLGVLGLGELVPEPVRIVRQKLAPSVPSMAMGCSQ